MSKRRFAIPAADALDSDGDDSSLLVAKRYFTKSSSEHLSSERSASPVVLGGGASGQRNASVVAFESCLSSDGSTSAGCRSDAGAAKHHPATVAAAASGSAAHRTVKPAVAAAQPQHETATAAPLPASAIGAARSVAGDKPMTAVVDAAPSSLAGVDSAALVREAKLSAASAAGTSAPARPGAIVVNARQRGNPLLKHLRRVPWEFGETVADYELGRVTCALYLSLKYHNLRPEYIHERLRLLGRSYDLRVLLTLCDIPEPSHPLKELARVCVLADCTLVVAFTVEEAARYLETYKAYEHKPPDLIMERPPEAGDLYARAVDCLTTVKSVSRTDAGSLLTRFGTVGRIVTAPDDDLCLCSGFGPLKAKRLGRACREPFLASMEKIDRVATAQVEEERRQPQQQPSK